MTGEKILFVDDEELVRKLVTTFLDKHGYEVTTATDGVEALALIGALEPDMLITDVRMPNMTGLELTRRVRANHRTAGLPIILLSAYNATDDVLAGYRHGADDYVPKPVEMTVLGAKVAGLLRRATGVHTPPTRRGAVVAFLHGKGGVGNTTLAVNTAVLMARTDGTSAVLLDLNREFPNADMLLDLPPEHRLDELAAYDLGDVEQTTFSALLTPHSPGLSMLAGPASPETGERITVPIARFALEHLRSEADYVVVDLPANFSDVNLAVIDEADVICIVTSTDIAALKASRDCLHVVHKLDVLSRDRILVVLNRTSAGGPTDDKIANFLDYAPDLTIPYDPKFHQAADEGRPLVSWRRLQPSGRAISDLATRLAAFRAQKQRAQLLWAG